MTFAEVIEKKHNVVVTEHPGGGWIASTKTGEKIVEQETLFDLFYALFAMDYKGE